MDATLAIRGGRLVRTTPFPTLRKWDYQELREVLDVFESGVTGRYGGTKVEAFERAFATAYGVPTRWPRPRARPRSMWPWGCSTRSPAAS